MHSVCVEGIRCHGYVNTLDHTITDLTNVSCTPGLGDCKSVWVSLPKNSVMWTLHYQNVCPTSKTFLIYVQDAVRGNSHTNSVISDSTHQRTFVVKKQKKKRKKQKKGMWSASNIRVVNKDIFRWCSLLDYWNQLQYCWWSHWETNFLALEDCSELFLYPHQRKEQGVDLTKYLLPHSVIPSNISFQHWWGPQGRCTPAVPAVKISSLSQPGLWEALWTFHTGLWRRDFWYILTNGGRTDGSIHFPHENPYI